MHNKKEKVWETPKKSSTKLHLNNNTLLDLPDITEWGCVVPFNLLAAPPCKGENYTICFRSTGAQWSYILALCKFCINVIFVYFDLSIKCSEK